MGEKIEVTADEPAPIVEAAPGDCARPRSSEMIYVINGDPRKQSKGLPQFPNPSQRPEGTEPALVLEFSSPVLTAADIAAGKMPRLDAASYLQLIRGAFDRSIRLRINCAGGRAVDALPIALALLEHPHHVDAIIIGRCSSSAVYLALAADVRTIVPGGTVLVHRSARFATREQFEALQSLSAEDKNVINESLNASDDVTASLLSSRLGVTEEHAREWMTDARAWPAAEALTKGFVQAIGGAA